MSGVHTAPCGDLRDEQFDGFTWRKSLTTTALEAVDIKPAQVAALLGAAVVGEADGHGLFDLPDLRRTEPAT